MLSRTRSVQWRNVSPLNRINFLVFPYLAVVEGLQSLIYFKDKYDCKFKHHGLNHCKQSSIVLIQVIVIAIVW